MSIFYDGMAKEEIEKMEDRYEKEKALLPCPFCGGEAIYFHDRPLHFEATCDSCDVRMSSPTYAILLEQWNRRVCQCHKEN